VSASPLTNTTAVQADVHFVISMLAIGSADALANRKFNRTFPEALRDSNPDTASPGVAGGLDRRDSPRAPAANLQLRPGFCSAPVRVGSATPTGPC
jgi:hypothetical protein